MKNHTQGLLILLTISCIFGMLNSFLNIPIFFSTIIGFWIGAFIIAISLPKVKDKLPPKVGTPEYHCPEHGFEIKNGCDYCDWVVRRQTKYWEDKTKRRK